jgi:hypothetical protein
MVRSFFEIVSSLFIVLASITFISAQAEDAFPGERRARREPPPSGVIEMLERKRIEKEKKDFEDLLSRGSEVVKLAEQLHKTFTDRGGQILSQSDRETIETIEKDVRKIRSELGGSDGDEKADQLIGSTDGLTVASGVDMLKSTTATLSDELQRSDRFSISAPAIEASNSTLKLVRFLLGK